MSFGAPDKLTLALTKQAVDVVFAQQAAPVVKVPQNIGTPVPSQPPVQPPVQPPTTTPVPFPQFPLPVNDVTWSDGASMSTGDVVEISGKKYSAKTDHVAAAANMPNTGASWEANWYYYDPLPKPVFAPYSEILDRNAAIYNLRNLTQHFFYEKVSGSYVLDNISIPTFQTNFIDSGVCNETDYRFPNRRKFFCIDIENGPAGSNTLRNFNSPRYNDQVSQMQQIAEMVRGTGNPAAFYQSWHFDVNNNENIQRYLFESVRPDKWVPPLQARFDYDRGSLQIANEFASHQDASMLRSYPYHILGPTTGINFSRYLYTIDESINKAKDLYEDQPLYLWVQPNSTDNFDPIPLATWNTIIQYLFDNPAVDGLIIFYLDKKTQEAGWSQVFHPSAQPLPVT